MQRTGIFRHLITVTLLFLVIGLSFPAFAEINTGNNPDKYTKVMLIADKNDVTGGDTVRISVEYFMEPGWHIYWLNPGDSGTPPKIEWKLPPGFSVTDPEWPAPFKIPTGPLTNYGYEDHAGLLQNLTIPEHIGNEPFTLEAAVNLLVCHDICIPENHDVSISFNNSGGGAGEAIVAAERKLPLNKDWPTIFFEQNGNIVFQITTADISGLIDASQVSLFPEDWGAIDNAANADLKITEDGFIVTQKRGDRALEKIPELPIVLSYKNTNNETKAIRLIAKLSSPQEALAVVTTADNATTAPPISTKLFQALLFALLGGLVLNLMPCVFPILSMKALSLVGLKEKEEKKARHYGLSYTAGILVSFAIIGGTLIALKSGGAQIGWGFQLQNPVIIISLIYLIFILGLNLAGLFEFSSRLSSTGQKLTNQSGNRGAFFTGVLATLVATPCTAPFMGAAMGFALTQPAFISLLVFLMLGFGLALPYLALCFIPALRTKLPKPGHWMETFRQFLAFPMFITAAWLVWVLSQQINSLSVFCILLSLIGIVFIIWLVKNLPGTEKKAARVFSKTIIVISAIFIVTTTFSAAKHTSSDVRFHMEIGGQNWEEFTPQRLDSLLSTTDTPVFVNMTAAWCITCKVNEKIALSTDSAKRIFEEYNIQYLKGDWTNQNPDITAYLNAFNRQGVPIYVFYGPRDEQTGKRPDPIVLPQILTPRLVEDTILENL